MNSQCINSFVIIDLETTGLPGYEVTRTKIIEMCLVAVSREHLLASREESSAKNLDSLLPRVLHKLNICVNPRKMIQPVTTELTGLYNELLEEEQSFNENLCDMLNGFLGRLTPPICLLAHNGSKFDFPLLKAELNKCGRILLDNILCADTYLGFRELLPYGSCNKHGNSVVISPVSTKNEVEKNKGGAGFDLDLKHVDSIDATDFQDKFSLEVILDSMLEKEMLNKDFIIVSPKNETTEVTLEYKETAQKINETTPVRSKSVRNLAPTLAKKTERNQSHSDKFARKRLFPSEFPDDGPAPKSFKLVDIYQFLLKKVARNSHQAECDVMQLLECIVALGLDFILWCDKNSMKFNLVKKMW